MSKNERCQDSPADLAYTDQMRERALRYIEEKRKYEDPELIFRQHCEVTFRYFMRQISQRLAGTESQNSDVESVAAPHAAQLKRGPSRGKHDSRKRPPISAKARLEILADRARRRRHTSIEGPNSDQTK